MKQPQSTGQASLRRCSVLHTDIRTTPPKPPQVEQHAVRTSGSGTKQTQAHNDATFGKLVNLSEPQFPALQNGGKSTYFYGRIMPLGKCGDYRY